LLLIAFRFAWAQDISINPNQPDGTAFCNQPVFVAPNFTMIATSSVTGMKISFSQGYRLGEDELRLSGNVGTVNGTWFVAQGYLMLSGSTNFNDYIPAIQQVQYLNNSASPTNGSRTLTFSLDDADYLPETGHFYRFIPKTGITWTTAKVEAESAAMKYHGLQGYLATITSAVENAFIQLKTKGVGWIGASDQEIEGVWRWVTGPEAGTQFWQGTSTGNAVNGMYNNWNVGEPNNLNDEDYAHITYFANNPAQSLRWNDLPNPGTSGDYTPAGYLVEYGGMPGDPNVKLTADISLKVNSVRFSSNRTFTKCQGDTVSLNRADQWATYVWSPAAGLSGATLSNPVATPADTSNYHVVATNGICKDSANFIVNINPLPISLLKKVVDVCAGNKAILDPGVHTSYLWNTGSTSRALFIDTEGKFSVKLTSDKGCIYTDSVSVYIRPYPKMDLSGLNKLVCGSKATVLNISKDKGEWLISNLNSKEQFNSPSIQVATYGVYPFGLKLSDSYGCSVETFLTIAFHETAIVNFGNDTTICNPNSLVLDAGAGLSSYQWSTGDTIRKYEVKKPGKYSVLVKNIYGCYTKDSVMVSFTDKPKLDLKNFESLICGSMSTVVNITSDKGKYQFSSKDPKVQINGMNTTVPVYGNYPFSFVSTDQYGCSSDTSVTMGFHKIPDVKFTIDESQCYGYNLQATYIGNANLLNSRFTWIFGGDTISNQLGRNIETIPLGVGQTKRDLKLTVNEEGCSNSDAIRDIHVIPTLRDEVK